MFYLFNNFLIFCESSHFLFELSNYAVVVGHLFPARSTMRALANIYPVPTFCQYWMHYQVIGLSLPYYPGLFKCHGLLQEFWVHLGTIFKFPLEFYLCQSAHSQLWRFWREWLVASNIYRQIRSIDSTLRKLAEKLQWNWWLNSIPYADAYSPADIKQSYNLFHSLTFMKPVLCSFRCCHSIFQDRFIEVNITLF